MMIKQKYSSASTSINSKKLPAIYRIVSKRIKETDKVIDYGCGKFFDNYNLPSNYVGYDPFNRNNDEILNEKYDVALCSNVLNVIMEHEVRMDVLRKLKELANTVFITIYEGDKTGVGKETKNDCYQLNMAREDYFPELMEVFSNVKLYNGCFECS